MVVAVLLVSTPIAGVYPQQMKSGWFCLHLLLHKCRSWNYNFTTLITTSQTIHTTAANSLVNCPFLLCAMCQDFGAPIKF